MQRMNDIWTSALVAKSSESVNAISLLHCLFDCLGSLVVLSATATLEVLGSNPSTSKTVIEFFYEILSSSSEFGFVPG